MPWLASYSVRACSLRHRIPIPRALSNPIKSLLKSAECLLQVLTVDLVLQCDPDGGNLARQIVHQRRGPRVDLPVALCLGTIALGLPVLRQQNERRRVCSLGREY